MIETLLIAALSGAIGGLFVAIVTSGIIPEIVHHGWLNDR